MPTRRDVLKGGGSAVLMGLAGSAVAGEALGTGAPAGATEASAAVLGPAAWVPMPSASAWTSWRTAPVTLQMGGGTNLVVCSVETSDQGGVNLDYVTLA